MITGIDSDGEGDGDGNEYHDHEHDAEEMFEASPIAEGPEGPETTKKTTAGKTDDIITSV